MRWNSTTSNVDLTGKGQKYWLAILWPMWKLHNWRYAPLMNCNLVNCECKALCYLSCLLFSSLLTLGKSVWNYPINRFHTIFSVTLSLNNCKTNVVHIQLFNVLKLHLLPDPTVKVQYTETLPLQWNTHLAPELSGLAQSESPAFATNI